jgi:hypothetical protein
VPDGAKPPPATPRWDLVALTVGYRRRQLGLSITEIAELVGVSTQAWSELEGGHRPRGFHRDEARRAATVLGWTDDSLDRIVRGQRPVDASGTVPTVAPARAVTPARAVAPARPPTPTPTAEAGTGATRGAPWFLAPIASRDGHGVRHVDPARLGVLGGLLILLAVILVFFR